MLGTFEAAAARSSGGPAAPSSRTSHTSAAGGSTPGCALKLRAVPPSGADARRDHVRVPAALAHTLDLDAGRQVRLAVATASAVFTVEGPSDGDAVEVYPARTSGGADGGLARLFGDRAAPAGAVASLWPVAPSRTELLTPLGGNAIRHFVEPGGDGSGLEEAVYVGSDRRFCLLVPAGGDVAPGTSLQIKPVQTTLAELEVPVSLWTLEGTASAGGAGEGAGGRAAARWHLTSSALDRRSYPGLEHLLGLPPHAPGRPFRYAASLVGFRWPRSAGGAGVVIGGRASMLEKAELMSTIQTALGHRADAVAFFLADAGPAAAHRSFGDRDGRSLADVPGVGVLAGLRGDELLDRMAPGDGTPGRGGFRIAQSGAVRRDPELRRAVARGLARAIAAWSRIPETP